MRFIRYSFLAVFSAAVLAAQVATGSLSGTVTDPNGAIVPGVKITATHVPTAQEFVSEIRRQATTSMAACRSGLNSLTAEKAGFKKLTRTNLEIRIAQRQSPRLALEVGEVQQTVEVTAEHRSSPQHQRYARAEPVRLSL